jgi:hypothetical protein
MYLLTNIRETISRSRGRPGGLGFKDDNRGGKPSSYQMSLSLDEVIKVLNKVEIRRSINDMLTKNRVLPKFLIFRNLILYHLIRRDNSTYEKTVEPFPFVKEIEKQKSEANKFFLNKIMSLPEKDLEREASATAEYTLRQNRSNINFFVNILAGAVGLAHLSTN